MLIGLVLHDFYQDVPDWAFRWEIAQSYVFGN
jgi:hypothetical protein